MALVSDEARITVDSTVFHLDEEPHVENGTLLGFPHLAVPDE